MDNDRLLLHSVHTDEGHTELYFTRAADDFPLGGPDGSFLFHKDGSITFKAWTNDEEPYVVVIRHNRTVILHGEDQLSMTEIDEYTEGDNILFDSVQIKGE